MNTLCFLILVVVVLASVTTTTTAFVPRTTHDFSAGVIHHKKSDVGRMGSSWLPVRFPIPRSSSEINDEDEEETKPKNNPFTDLITSGWKSMEVDFSNIKMMDFGTVLKNLNDDSVAFGDKGEFYFIAQALLVVCIVLGGIPFVGDALSVLLGPVSILGGLGVAALSVLDLGSDSLSPFPATTSTSTLKTTGIYQELRHPMYTGLLLIMLGLAIATDSATRLVLTLVLGYLLEIKSTKEEEFLVQRFPAEYKDYQQTVTEKFFPKTIMKQLPWNNN